MAYKNQLTRVMKAINSISEKSLNESDLKNHRKSVERAGRFTAPRGKVIIRPFKVGDIVCEEIIPKNGHKPDHAILYAHGGGYNCGGLFLARVLAIKMAAATGFTTYTFAYRLAPEAPYPAALKDGIKVWRALTAKKYKPRQILLAGDSAGGNLVLCMAQMLRDKKKTGPGCLLLFSPWTDMTGTAASYEEKKDIDPILTKKYIMESSEAYIAGAGEPSDPRFSPLFGDLSALPPVYIMVGRNEILLDDSIRLRDEIEKAGGTVELDIEEAGWHVYQQMPVPMAKRAMKRLSVYVNDRKNNGK